MKSPKDFELTDDDKRDIAAITANIEQGAEIGHFPLLFGPINERRRVFETVLRDALTAGWDAGFTPQGMLVIRGARS